MRSIQAIVIILLFLLQAFAGIQLVNTKTIKEEPTAELILEGADTPVCPQGTRNGGGCCG